MITANLDPYRKDHFAIPFQILPGRNPVAVALPWIKLSAAFGMGVVACVLLLAVT
jgi:hypothetical protein